jgi:hypothetical protein
MLYKKYGRIKPHSSITVTEGPKTRTVFSLASAAVVGSNPTGRIDVRVSLFYFCCCMCIGSFLATGRSPI